MTMDRGFRSIAISAVIGASLGLALGIFFTSQHFNNRYKLSSIFGDWLTNEPGFIKVMSTRYLGGSPVPVSELRGDFLVKEGNPNDPTILSHGTGGACYIADLEVAEYPRKKNPTGYYGDCADSSECNPCPQEVGGCNNKLLGWPGPGWHGYCIREDPGSALGKCWVRPGGVLSHCLRSIDKDGKPWPVGERQDLPVINADIGFGIDPATVAWRVLTCLNAYDPNLPYKDGGGCPLTRTGPIFTLPQP
jgi:hypothetical protein